MKQKLLESAQSAKELMDKIKEAVLTADKSVQNSIDINWNEIEYLC